MKKLRLALVPLVLGLITALLPISMAAAQTTTVRFIATYSGQGSFRETYPWHSQTQTHCFTKTSQAYDIDTNTILTLTAYPNSSNCTGSSDKPVGFTAPGAAGGTVGVPFGVPVAALGVPPFAVGWFY